jgi:predicted transcriptional regulator/antitoxin component YwqK of YwqJK toxin-antitoxin module
MTRDTNLTSTEISENLELTEIKTLTGKLSEIHNDIKKLMESSKKLRFEAALENSRQEYSHAFLNYVFEDIEAGLNRSMVKKCPEKETCTSAFTAFLQNNAGLIKNKKIDEALILDNSKKLNELKCGAPYSICEQCFSEVSSLFTKQISLMRSMRIYENNQRQKPDISVLETGVVMNEILEPISNKQRLDILKAVAFEPKSFSALSKLTALIAGHLHFHLHKLLDGNLILQQHERGDYMITEKGFKILKSLNEMYFSLQYSPPQDSTENTL